MCINVFYLNKMYMIVLRSRYERHEKEDFRAFHGATTS